MGAVYYEHFGMTEMGLGGAVECDCHKGLHIRENDLCIEIINPDTREPLPNGEWGEMVFTTLTRKAMPFIRYRTGDIARLLPGKCSCGSELRRIDSTKGRFTNIAYTMPELEEEIFSMDDVIDFKASYDNKTKELDIELARLTDSSYDDYKRFYPAKRYIILN